MKKWLTEAEIRAHLKSQCTKHGEQRAMAERLEISTAYLSDVLNGKRGIGASIAKALGYRMETRFVRNSK